MMKFKDLWALEKKEAISSFVQSGNFERLTLTGFAVGHLTHYTKFPHEIFFKIFKPNVKIFLQSCQSAQAAIVDFIWKVVTCFIQITAKLDDKVAKIFIRMHDPTHLLIYFRMSPSLRCTPNYPTIQYTYRYSFKNYKSHKNAVKLFWFVYLKTLYGYRF